MNARRVSVIILAAGKSTRIKQKTPKIILDLGGIPLIFHLIYQLCAASRYVKDIIVVLGYKKEIIRPLISKVFPRVRFVYQKKLNGTAKAVQSAAAKATQSEIMVLCGDTPLMKKKTLVDFIRTFRRRRCAAMVMTSVIPQENSLGRILRNEQGRIVGIIEKRDLARLKNGGSPDEVNSGIYCFKRKDLISGLKKIKVNSRKKEYYLTDIIEIFTKASLPVGTYQIEDWTQIMGVNDQKDLALAYNILNQNMLEKMMAQGVRIIDPASTYVNWGVKIRPDTVIYPFTFIENDVIIGSNCRIGPFVRLRKGSVVNANTSVGNFVEINRSVLAKGVRAKHFSYIGDAYIGEGSNIGAGTVFANYDGKHKHKTVLGKKVFIGCDTVIVAPVKIGSKAMTGAGSVVTKDVKANTVVVGVPARRFRKQKG